MMKKVLLYFSIILATGCISASGQADTRSQIPPTEPETETKKYEVQLQYSQESLTRNLGTWRIASLYVERKFANRSIVWGSYRVSERRSTRDQEFIGGAYRPFGKKWAATGEAMFSNTRKYVGRFSLLGEGERKLGKGFVGHVGARYTAYDAVKATSIYGLTEKYWGSNRAAYTLYLTRLTNAGTAPTHRFQYTRYFGEELNSLGATFVTGREHENLGPGIGILRSQTWSIAGSARWWLSKRVGVNFDGLIHRQGDLYYRRGLGFGVRYRF